MNIHRALGHVDNLLSRQASLIEECRRIAMEHGETPSSKLAGMLTRIEDIRIEIEEIVKPENLNDESLDDLPF